MNTAPSFSVLIPAFNAAGTIVETLDSLIAQTMSSWEAVVVDDGSTDETADRVREYARRDGRIVLLTQPNAGTGAARNHAARHAAAPWLALLDADDAYLPTYFERVSGFIASHPGFDIYSVDGFVRGVDGLLVPDDLTAVHGVTSFTADDFIAQNRIRAHQVFRRSVMSLTGGFSEDPRMRNEDWDFWLRALLLGAKHIHDPERLRIYSVSSSAKTADLAACYAADVFMFRTLLRGPLLSPRQRRMAQAALRNAEASAAFELVLPLRRELEQRLRHGDFARARTLYWQSRAAWGGFVRFTLGLLLIGVSPGLFATLLRRRSAR